MEVESVLPKTGKIRGVAQSVLSGQTVYLVERGSGLSKGKVLEILQIIVKTDKTTVKDKHNEQCYTDTYWIDAGGMRDDNTDVDNPLKRIS